MDKNKTIYISGPMTGLPDLNFPAFYAAQKLLEAQGYTVVNPAEVGKHLNKKGLIPKGLTEKQLHLFYVREDIAAMITGGCMAIYLLKGWELSIGAWMEVDVARMLQFEFVYETKQSVGNDYETAIKVISEWEAIKPSIVGINKIGDM